MEKITEQNQFETILKNHPVVLTYFSRHLCGVCHAMKPQVDSMLKAYPSIVSVEVNLDENPEVASQKGIFSVPAIVIYYQAKEFVRQAGFLNLSLIDKALHRFIEFESLTDGV